MKVFDTDLGGKYIFLMIEGKRYDILFRDRVLKGIYYIQVRDDTGVAD